MRITFALVVGLTLATITQAGETPAETARRANAGALTAINSAPDGGKTGESPFAWSVNWYLGRVMSGCRVWANDDWMAPTEETLLKLVDKMATGPDGYKGFIGPYEYNAKEYWCDGQVSDAILIKHMLEFAMIVKENPALQAKYQKSCDLFIEIAKKDLIEKWAVRGTLIEDGPFAGYIHWDTFCKPDDIGGKWFRVARPGEGDNPMPCHPFNKAMDMATCMLQIYYLTGDESYKETATKIHARFKASLNRFDGYYTWNYWEPISMTDFSFFGIHVPIIHFVDTHPSRPYQHGELYNILLAYNMGVVYTDEDMQRFVKTNLTAMWNGDKENPQWSNSNSRLPGQTAGAPSQAGTLWSVLAPFDATILELLEKATRADDALGQKVLENLKKTPPGFNRKYAPDAVVEEPPWTEGIKESTGQMFAVVIPSVMPMGYPGQTMIVSKAHGEEDDLEIFVKPAAGGEPKRIATNKLGGRWSPMRYNVWDGKIDGVKTPGEYVVIWRYKEGERSWPVTVR